MGMVVIGAIFVDIKGYPDGVFIPNGRNVGRVEHSADKTKHFALCYS